MTRNLEQTQKNFRNNISCKLFEFNLTCGAKGLRRKEDPTALKALSLPISRAISLYVVTFPVTKIYSLLSKY